MDGAYVDGNNNSLQSRTSQLLHESGEIGQGATIADQYKNYVPELPQGEEGYVFEGWEIGSGWGIPGDQLTAFAVQEDAEGHFVPKPTAFPIIVRARWRWVGGPIPGDVNGDGRTELLDAQLLFAFASGQPLQAEEEGLDLNADGHVNSRDALLLLRRLAAG